MLDLKYVLEHIEDVRTNCRNRNVPRDVIDGLDTLYETAVLRRETLQSLEAGRRRQNEVAKATSMEKDPTRRS